MRKDIKDAIQKRKIAYIYLLHRMFEGNFNLMHRIMKIPSVTIADLQDWDLDYHEAVYETIREEDAKGVDINDPNSPVPSIKSIKEKVLRRCNQLINATTDPSKLAVVYKTLSEFEAGDDKKEKSVLDAINESIKPLTVKQREKKKTMLDRMNEQKGIVTKAANKELAEDDEDDDENEEQINEL